MIIPVTLKCLYRFQGDFLTGLGNGVGFCLNSLAKVRGKFGELKVMLLQIPDVLTYFPGNLFGLGNGAIELLVDQYSTN